jgi:DNA polymerase III sliding clamp (beta) subunit (PCNA family)
MSLLDSLKFVKGGVARKDLAPVLNHFRIQDGVISGSNGNITLSAPIALSLNCQPKAQPFTKAIEICESMDAVPTLSLTKAGKLTVAAGKFRVHIDCWPEDWPMGQPEGQEVAIQPEMMEAFKVLAPLIGEDASRPWARGILLRDGSAFATNNVVIGQYWVNCTLPFDMNIPEECIRELLRVKGEPPIRMRATDRSVAFIYADGRYVQSQLLSTEWPNVGPVLDRQCAPMGLPDGFFLSLANLSPYVDAARRVYFTGSGIATHLSEGEGAAIAFGEDGGILHKGVYNLDLLRCLDGLVASVDWSLYPAPALFFGPNSDAGYPVFRGAIVGMKADVL